MLLSLSGSSPTPTSNLFNTQPEEAPVKKCAKSKLQNLVFDFDLKNRKCDRLWHPSYWHFELVIDHFYTFICKFISWIFANSYIFYENTHFFSTFEFTTLDCVSSVVIMALTHGRKLMFMLLAAQSPHGEYETQFCLSSILSQTSLFFEWMSSMWLKAVICFVLNKQPNEQASALLTEDLGFLRSQQLWDGLGKNPILEILASQGQPVCRNCWAWWSDGLIQSWSALYLLIPVPEQWRC